MADFMTNLWSSVFEAGPTPTLLMATNATFAALQALLLALLAATHSVHFVILSVLCGGLWYAINWFATELQAARAAEDEAERLRRRRRRDEQQRLGASGDLGDVADDEGENTEVEAEPPPGSTTSPSVGLNHAGGHTTDGGHTADRVHGLSAGSSGLQSSGAEGEARRRTAQRRSGDTSGDVSTDSEWEKVDDVER